MIFLSTLTIAGSIFCCMINSAVHITVLSIDVLQYGSSNSQAASFASDRSRIIKKNDLQHELNQLKPVAYIRVMHGVNICKDCIPWIADDSMIVWA